MAQCKNCGNELRAGDTQCPMCGEKVDTTPDICPNCFCPLENGDTTCPICGTQVGESQPAAQWQQTTTAPEVPADDDGLRICPNCGCPLDDDDENCSICGTHVGKVVRLTTEPVQPTVPAGDDGLRICPNCSCPLDDDDENCTICGTHVGKVHRASAPASGPAQGQSSPQVPQTDVEICACGCPLDADDTTCPTCGRAVPGRRASTARTQTYQQPQQTQVYQQPQAQVTQQQPKKTNWLMWFGVAGALTLLSGGALLPLLIGVGVIWFFSKK